MFRLSNIQSAVQNNNLKPVGTKKPKVQDMIEPTSAKASPKVEDANKTQEGAHNTEVHETQHVTSADAPLTDETTNQTLVTSENSKEQISGTLGNSNSEATENLESDITADANASAALIAEDTKEQNAEKKIEASTNINDDANQTQKDVHNTENSENTHASADHLSQLETDVTSAAKHLSKSEIDSPVEATTQENTAVIYTVETKSGVDTFNQESPQENPEGTNTIQPILDEIQNNTDDNNHPSADKTQEEVHNEDPEITHVTSAANHLSQSEIDSPARTPSPNDLENQRILLKVWGHSDSPVDENQEADITHKDTAVDKTVIHTVEHVDMTGSNDNNEAELRAPSINTVRFSNHTKDIFKKSTGKSYNSSDKEANNQNSPMSSPKSTKSSWIYRYITPNTAHGMALGLGITVGITVMLAGIATAAMAFGGLEPVFIFNKVIEGLVALSKQSLSTLGATNLAGGIGAGVGVAGLLLSGYSIYSMFGGETSPSRDPESMRIVTNNC